MTDQISYVRRDMLPQLPPPTRESGAVKWMRENLFAGPVNSVLTLLGLAVVAWLVSFLWPWLAASVWNADSLPDCRRIIGERWGEGHEGACWAVIKHNWRAYAFGFYPFEMYWRPILVLGLLFFALAPVLFNTNRRIANIVLATVTVIMVVALLLLDSAFLTSHWFVVLVVGGLWALQLRRPNDLIWFTAIYPALAFWLLWGGSLWIPVMAMAGFIAGWAAFRATAPIGGPAQLVAVILAPVLWWLFVAGPLAGALDRSLPLGIQAISSDKFGGFLLAITIGVAAITMSLPFGILLALGRKSDMFLIKAMSVCFIEFIRGVPLITLLFTASLLLNYFLPPGTNFDIILRVIIMVTLFASAYIAEVVRGGLAALPRGQYEAADALGLDYGKAQRLIILPQALKISIPGIVSTFIGMFKDTTLVVFVGLLDPLKGITDAVRANMNWKGIYWEPYIFVAVIFFIFNFSMSRYSMYLERKLKTDHR
jgi:general L-amino acid transport system permease protein